MKTILIISTTGMGDCLWATPGIRALKKSFPDAAIDLLVRRQWRDVYFGNPHIRKVIYYKPQWYHQLALLPKLLMTHYDHILIFHSNRDIGRLISGLRYSEIWSHQKLPNIHENRILKFSKTTHPILRRAAIIEKLKGKSDGLQMEIFPNERDHAEATLFLKKNRLIEKEFAYFNIGASLPHKRWPCDRIISLARLFLQKTTMGIVFGGGPEDAQTITKIENKLDSKRVTHAYHRQLRENCALISQARLMITTDTGPMHIGFATRTPTVALFGPTRPEDSGPCQIDSNLCQVIQSTALNELDHTTADNNNFFDSITVSMVWDKVNLLLN